MSRSSPERIYSEGGGRSGGLPVVHLGPQEYTPNPTFKDGTLLVHGYRFETTVPWGDPGSTRLVARGVKVEGAHEIPVVARIEDNAGLERETHVLSRLSKIPEGASRIFRTLDLLTIPPTYGGVKVLILKHPGDNILSQYYPVAHRRLFLLPESHTERVTLSSGLEMGTSLETSAKPLGILSREDPLDDSKARVIDISSFIHFALQAVQCVELIHAVSYVHGNIRPSSFHWQESDDTIHFAHFGQQIIHLDLPGGGSRLILESSCLPAEDQELVKEIMCYMAPEQISHVQSGVDHRSDLYGLGAVFWRLLTGRRMFSSTTIRGIMHNLTASEPTAVHELRPDIPLVISKIIHKLLSKNPDDRYCSASGLKEDLIECHRNLTQSRASESETRELIDDFPLGRYDRHSFFHISNEILGRENESELIKRHIKEFTSRSRRLLRTNSSRNGTSLTYSTRGGSAAGRSLSDTRSTASSPSVRSGEAPLDPAIAPSTISESSDGNNVQKRYHPRRLLDDIYTRALIVRGPTGSGKSALIRECLSEVKGHALLGQAKFDPGDPTPYSALLGCLAVVFRQLLTLSNAEIFSFGETLRERLGPQMTNLTLLYSVVPEVEALVTKVWANGLGPAPADALGTAEARARFENLIVDIILELTASRTIILFLDDLQNADGPSLSLMEALARARVNILIIATLRSGHPSTTERLDAIFGTRLVTIGLKPLNEHAITELVMHTLHISPEAAAPLVSSLIKHSNGNAFNIRSLLMLLKNEDYIVFSWTMNAWSYDPTLVQDFLESRSRLDPNNLDASFVVQHMQELPNSTKRFLSIAAVIGPIFDIKLVSAYMEAVESSDSESSDEGSIGKKLSHSWVSGLQSALSETMISSRGKDAYTFTHDQYREAALAVAKQQPGGLMAISATLVDMLLEEPELGRDDFKISDHILRSIPQLLGRPNQQSYVQVLTSAGSQALARGALESALLYYDAAHSLAIVDGTIMQSRVISSIFLKLAELLNWKGDFDRSDQLLATIQQLSAEERVAMLRTKARNLFSQQLVAAGMDCLLKGLRELGVHLKREYSNEEFKQRHMTIRQHIMDVGLEYIKNLPVINNEICNLRATLLSEVYTFAYFTDPRLARMIAYEAISLALVDGLSPNNGMAFISFACVCVEFRDFDLGAPVGRMAIELSTRLSTDVEKARAHIFYVSLLAPSDSVHFMQTWGLALQGYKYARAGGDPLFMGFASIHLLANRFYTSQPMEDVIAYADEIMLDFSFLPKVSETVCLVLSFQMACRALAGQTYATSAETIYDLENWNDREYTRQIEQNEQTADSTLNWYYSVRLCALYSLGFHNAVIKFSTFTSATQHHHPNHRHGKMAYFYTGLALCASARNSEATHLGNCVERAKACLEELAVLMEPAEVNVGAWFYLLSAEIASIEGSPHALAKYNMAISAADKGRWTFEHGWATFLAGSHLHRLGGTSMAYPLWQQGLQKFHTLGAFGAMRYLSTISGPYVPVHFLGHAGPSVEVGIQTEPENEASINSAHDVRDIIKQRSPIVQPEAEASLERMIQHIPSKDLASLIMALQAVATDLNLSSSLERLTTLMQETTGVAADAVIIVRDDDHGDYRIHTHVQSNAACVTFEPSLPLDSPITRTNIVVIPLVQHVLHSGEALHLHSIDADPRFRDALEASETGANSVLALPVRSRGITLGALYVSSDRQHAFSERDMLVLSLLATQAAVLISNGFLFASLRRSTQANLRSITEQRIALEAARKSQEEALQATKVKSIFLANMSHEMRTPFASFYGLLGLLAETDLDAEQLELVGTARQSCELLLETISALLDFSKLEAHAVKLNTAPVSPAELIADCQELLLNLATEKGLELTYDIDPDVPPSVNADGPRIRQVLQNLIGNALKFTSFGAVTTRISIDKKSTIKVHSREVVIQIEVSDSGIGMSKSDLTQLFKPFSQVDQSATKRFGGTGLGLSICRELLNLMRGKISVSSAVGVGSTFTCQIPVEVSPEPSARLAKQLDEIATLRQALSEPDVAHVLAYSPYSSTRLLLQSTLQGLRATVVTSLDELKVFLSTQDLTPTSGNLLPARVIPEAVIVDAPQAEMEELRTLMTTSASFDMTRVLHLYVRTAETLHRNIVSEEGPSRRAVLRCAKPLRPLALLRVLVQARTETPLLPPIPLRQPELLEPFVAPPSASPSTTLKLSRPNALGEIRKSTSAPAAPRASRPTPKIVDNFTAEQLQSFKEVQILIAEDNPVAQKLLFRQLSNLGFNVTPTSNGQEAIDCWEAQPLGSFKMALFDHHMPICDGLTAATRIREKERERAVPSNQVLPIISLTADAQSQAKDDCLAAGMQQYLTKPLRPDDLLGLVFRFVLDQDDHPAALTMS